MAVTIYPPSQLDENQILQSAYDDETQRLRVEAVNAGSFLGDIVYDALSVAYPDPEVEVYSYFTGGLGGTLVATLTVTYTDGSKTVLISVVRT